MLKAGFAQGRLRTNDECHLMIRPEGCTKALLVYLCERVYCVRSIGSEMMVKRIVSDSSNPKKFQDQTPPDIVKAGPHL